MDFDHDDLSYCHEVSLLRRHELHFVVLFLAFCRAREPDLQI